MNTQERTEVREMIKSTLEGWNEATATREKLINISLNSIDAHLAKLNGKVSEHEKIINQNIPHTVALCPQAKIIEELKEWQAEQDGVETAEESFIKRSQIADTLARTEKRDRRQFMFNVITAILTIVAISITLYFSSQSNQSAKAAEIEAKTTNQIVAPVVRGSFYDPFAIDTTKKTRLTDTVNVDRIIRNMNSPKK